MKLLNYQQNEQIRRGILIKEDKILDLEATLTFLGEDISSMESDAKFFKNYYSFKQRIDAFLIHKVNEISSIPLSSVKILSPILHPSKIICLGLNYHDHAEETGEKLPKLPMLFSKAPSAIIGMDDEIIIPKLRKKITGVPFPIKFLDYEVELAIIIGKSTKRITIEDAHKYIFGFTILNDVSARMEQMSDKQFFRSKSFDTFAPLGPWIVTSDQIGDPMNLRISCQVNGKVLQDSNTRNMNFNINQIVSFISEEITLVPGDIIGTGTPAGVGAGKKPPFSLKAGDLIEMTIENIGTLRNRIKE